MDRPRSGSFVGAGAAEESLLLQIRVPKDEIACLARRSPAVERIPQLAWLCTLPDPESMPLDELKDALEAHGFATDADVKNAPPSLDRLLSPVPEPDQLWLARRAATEVAIDSDLRFVRFQDMVVPDTGAGQLMGGLGLSTAISELKRLLDPDDARRPDPLVEKLTAIEARGRKGAVVTRLEIRPDLDGVTVESTLWICIGTKRWVPFGSRTATVRSADVRAGAGQKLADDPQVKSAFGIVESLGLGAVPAELKDAASGSAPQPKKPWGWLARLSTRTWMRSRFPSSSRKQTCLRSRNRAHKLTEAFHKLGNQVVIAGRRAAVLKAICEANLGMRSFTFDVTAPDSVRDVAGKVAEQFSDSDPPLFPCEAHGARPGCNV